ncbi:SAM-dependent methyltransferase [Yinghuangia sp. ASG 101]|uniref:SAM-dependent methyltransferase n=1 Tax=Yinghuangia sp. ASG 101 TaxID=2896848 RepID=UPI001E2C7C77|nr:SAM-dependent methyltransferase [Yinghuangia sp. ASG 101]UGQ12646.1 SAM-dependent methyltransferase [Yinghuangia sp. ASG 101]
MTNHESTYAQGDDRDPTTEIDISRPSQARSWNNWLGGMHNFSADRTLANRLAVENPGLVERVRTTRHFLTRAVRHLAADAGIRQFLDIGSGLPVAGNTHEIAQHAAPDARVVYADDDPQVVLYAREILTAAEAKGVAFLEASLLEPKAVLDAASETLDLSQPTAIVLSGILGHVPTYEQACSIVEALLAPLPAGSYLLSHDISDSDPHWRAVQASHNSVAPLVYNLRTPEQIAGYFRGLELVEPGVVSVTEWHRDADSRYSDEWARLVVDIVGGIGRKA